MAQQGLERITVRTTGPILKGRGVNWAGAQAVANESIIGIADHNAPAAGEDLRVVPIGCTADADAGAVISSTERRLMTDASGRLIPWTTGNNVAARLVPRNTQNVASVGIGQTVEVMPCPA